MALIPTDYRIEIEPISGEVEDMFDNSVKNIIEQTKRLSVVLSRKWVEIAREEAPIDEVDPPGKNREEKEVGLFRESIISEQFEEKESIGFLGYSSSPLSTFINYGTVEHEIFPKFSGGVLSFYWEKGKDGPGDYVFSGVNHPGTGPDEYFLRAIERFDLVVQESLQFISEKWSTSFSGAQSEL